MSTRRIFAWLFAGIAPMFFLAFTHAPAQATTASPVGNQLSYSTDGENYSHTPLPVFANVEKIIPGESTSRSLWVRNDLSKSIEITVHTNTLEGANDLRAEASPKGIISLSAGETTTVVIRAWLPEAAGNATQNISSENISIRVRASEKDPLGEKPDEESAPPVENPDSQPPQDQDQLGDTGFFPRFLPLAIGALITGGILFALSRRNRLTILNTEGDSR
ncbi:hypothetical protein ACX5K5_14590 [Glutamicibacter bergerei]